MGLESVGDFAIQAILEKLGPQDIATVACVSKRFYSFASDDSLWIKICFRELALTQPFDHLGNPLPSFKVTPLPPFPPFLFNKFFFCVEQTSIIHIIRLDYNYVWEKKKQLFNSLIPSLRVNLGGSRSKGVNFVVFLHLSKWWGHAGVSPFSPL